MNEQYEIAKIDKKEMVKQIEEDYLKGDYTELKIIVAEGSKDPICSLVNHGSTYKELGILYMCLEETKKTIENRYPLAVKFAKECLNLEGRTEIDVNK